MDAAEVSNADKLLKKQFRGTPINVHTRTQDITRGRFEPDSADLLMLIHTAEFIKDFRKKAMDNILKMLKPGGFLFIHGYLSQEASEANEYKGWHITHPGLQEFMRLTSDGMVTHLNGKTSLLLSLPNELDELGFNLISNDLQEYLVGRNNKTDPGHEEQLLTLRYTHRAAAGALEQMGNQKLLKQLLTLQDTNYGFAFRTNILAQKK